MSLLSGLPAIVASKAVTGFTVATLAVAGAGAVTATAATGSPNPAVWGKTVTAAVTTCKNDLKDGVHGIGPCVSAVAKHKASRRVVCTRPARPARPVRPARPARQPAAILPGPPRVTQPLPLIRRTV
jgi:hypothetical protein